MQQNKVKDVSKFLCCFCGIFIKKNRANLTRHEQLHEMTTKKLLCEMEDCGKKFQNKSNYAKHWKQKHAKQTMSDVANSVEKYPEKMIRKREESGTSNGLSDSSIISFNIEDVMKKCLALEPYFGKLLYLDHL